MVIQNFINGAHSQKDRATNPQNFTDYQNIYLLRDRDIIFRHLNKKEDSSLPALTCAIEQSSVTDIINSLKSAFETQQTWKKSTLIERKLFLKYIISFLKLQSQKFIEIEARDLYLNESLIKKSSVDWGIQKLESLFEQIPENTSPTGVLSALLPCDLPTRYLCERIIPALLAGNTCVIKFSSQTPLISDLWSQVFSSPDIAQFLNQIYAEDSQMMDKDKIIQMSELWSRLVQIVYTQDREVQKFLIVHPLVKGVILWGDNETLKQVKKLYLQLGLDQNKKFQLFGATKNATLDLAKENQLNEKKRNLLETFMFGQGQLAFNASRLFILEKKESEWKSYLKEELQKLKPSFDLKSDALWLPLKKNKSLNLFSQIKTQAQNDHAHFISADDRAIDEINDSVLTTEQIEKFELKKYFVTPFFTMDMTKCSTLQQDQYQGPAFILSVVKYPFDIAKHHNVSYLSHSLQFWAEDAKPFEKLINELETSLVVKNQWSLHVQKSFFGSKLSFWGLTDDRLQGYFYSNVKDVI